MPEPTTRSAPGAAAPEFVVPWDVPGRGWFARDVHDVARDLLGSLLTRRSEAGDVTLRISEVEAYDGERDPGSHAYRGRTERNRAMYGEPGRLYVYRHLGLHHCVNVVTGPVGRPSAVLIRAGEVVRGADTARARRSAVGRCDSDQQIARGPARLAVSLDLDLRHYGAVLTDPDGELVLHRAPTPGRPAVAAGPRVGVSGTGGDGTLYPWRYWLAGDRTVSAYRRVSTRAR
ncbi:DNA-3-methyladenine glycosylase [Cellulosimicrobium arenosum]|uniref:Putative 3-methyladenine DNA glycosylase n=1 Tax=Cellulosimicrobium arenosum TaxID=2708133 RepID=A0A927G8Y0_9MICO|nr:DNA-3-methyladenine glycosylase [Cellulosimicrobium arenosum]MBD8079138.1 DNA-3-methyladenine glycosylase [Cellulosimicrobium arenosum]